MTGEGTSTLKGHPVVSREAWPSARTAFLVQEKWARDRVFLGTSALLFVASVGGTVLSSRAMSGGVPMPGGWTLSMMWMPMRGQAGLAAGAAFLGMWMMMMVAM